MQNKLRQLILSALKRNTYTANLPLEISMRKYDVYVSGEVESAQHVNEVAATIEAVSPYLRVHTKLIVMNRPKATTR